MQTKSKKGDFNDCSDADIIVISLGVPPEPNKSRLDFLEGTIKEVDTIINPIMDSGFDGIIMRFIIVLTYSKLIIIIDVVEFV